MHLKTITEETLKGRKIGTSWPEVINPPDVVPKAGEIAIRLELLDPSSMRSEIHAAEGAKLYSRMVDLFDDGTWSTDDVETLMAEPGAAEKATEGAVEYLMLMIEDESQTKTYLARWVARMADVLGVADVAVGPMAMDALRESDGVADD